MPEYLRRPAVEPDAKVGEHAPPTQLDMTGRAAPEQLSDDRRPTSPAPRFRYRPAGVAGAGAADSTEAAVEPPPLELPAPGPLMASADPQAIQIGAGVTLSGNPTDPQYWAGFTVGAGEAFTQAIPRLVASVQALPELAGAAREFAGVWRTLSEGQRRALLEWLGVQALAAQLGKTNYQHGHALGEQLAGALLGAGGDRALKLLRSLRETGELVELIARLRSREPGAAAATPDGHTFDPTTVEPPGSSGNFNKKLSPRDGFFKPNEDYRVGPHTYYTDGLGRVRRVSGELKLPPKARDRNAYQQTKKAGKEGGPATAGQDDGGHLIASMFDGAGERINMKAMRRDLNQNGDWRDLEREWAAALRAGQGVRVDIRVIYEPGSAGLRASAFDIEYWMNGQRGYKLLSNDLPANGGVP